MAIEHNTLTGVELHEPKGVSAATAQSVYSATGSGSGIWKKVDTVMLSGVTSTGTAGDLVLADGSGGFTLSSTAHGNVYFYNIPSPYTLAVTGTNFQKINATTQAGGSAQLITEGSDSKLTYTGTLPVDLDFVFNASISQTSGSNADLEFAIYKNGVVVPGSNVFITAKNNEKHIVSCHADVSVASNDYFEVYAKNHSGTGDIEVYTLSVMATTAGT